MPVKTITITEDAYAAITKLKHSGESFSELFKRLGRKQLRIKDILSFVKHTPEEAKEFGERILEVRNKMDKDMEEKIKRVRIGFERVN